METQTPASVSVETFLEPAILYRVAHRSDSAGLWYDEDAVPTNRIHTVKGCAAAQLPMGLHPIFRSEGRRWISTTDTFENLKRLFSESDMEQLTPLGYVVQEIKVAGYRRFNFDTYAHEVYCVEDLIELRIIDKLYS